MTVGRHRPFIYDGLHFVQAPPKPGLIHALIVSLVALVFAIIVIVGIMFAFDGMGIPVKWTGNNIPLFSILGTHTASS